MHSEKIDLLTTALSAVQRQLKPAAKNRHNPRFKSTENPKGSPYADLESIFDSCRLLLAANGLVVSQITDFHEGHMVLKTMLIHTSGQWISGDYAVNPETPTPQSLGTALKYARRYALEAIIGIVSSDDPEDNDGEPINKAPDNTPPRFPLTLERQAMVQTVKDNLARVPKPIGAVVVESNGPEEAPWPDEQAPKADNPGSYVMTFSKHHKGKTLGQMGPNQVQGFMNYLHSEAEKTGKPISDAGKEFIYHADKYLSHQTTEDDLPF